MESLPTGLVTDLMEQCQLAYKKIPPLWEISYVQVDACGKHDVNVISRRQIFEESDDIKPYTSNDVQRILWKSVFLNQKMPLQNLHQYLINNHFYDPDCRERERVIIVTGFKKWGKRLRGEDD